MATMRGLVLFGALLFAVGGVWAVGLVMQTMALWNQWWEAGVVLLFINLLNGFNFVAMAIVWLDVRSESL